ncbi:hypothetical protein KUTeg_017719 [Tegillarca granosa]|uniref:Uncharacterized protein n=1 Tax=Tegillarca granosa TaxID=220873 RepID=A0ABQ9EJS6_TEGGR|nr:hypothetical protein KUTeg_017719 [Tegillarca granosa]
MAAPRRETPSNLDVNFLSGNMQPRFQNQNFRANLNAPRNQRSFNGINEQEYLHNRGNWTNLPNKSLGPYQNDGPRMPHPDPVFKNDFGNNQNFVNRSYQRNQYEASYARFQETSSFEEEQQEHRMARENVVFQKGRTDKLDESDRPYENSNQMHTQQSFPNKYQQNLPGNTTSIPQTSLGMGEMPPAMLPSNLSGLNLNRPILPSDSFVNRAPPPMNFKTNNIPNTMEPNLMRMPPPMVPMQQNQNLNQNFQPNTFQNLPQSNPDIFYQTQSIQLEQQPPNQHFSSQNCTQMALKEKETGPINTENKWLQQFLESRKSRKNKQQTCQKPMIKNELDNLKKELQNEENLKALHAKIESRKRKRLKKSLHFISREYMLKISKSSSNICSCIYILLHRRLKRLRKERYDEKLKEMTEREEKTRKIDEWRDKITQEEIHQKEEKELKSTADVILNEVRKKLVDANKTIELLHGLQKLRTLRKDRLECQGVITKSNMNEQFETDVQEQLTIMKKQQEIYIAEEKALKVMLETEHEETKVKEQEKSRLEHEEDQNQLLFGHNELHSLDNSLFPYWQFYHQASLNKESLIQIRLRPAAIVSPIAGTTRDIVETALNIGGYPVLLSDTAGLHDTSDMVEKEGKLTWKISLENILDVIFHAFVLENGYSKKTYKKKLNMIFIMLYFYNFCFEKFF